MSEQFKIYNIKLSNGKSLNKVLTLRSKGKKPTKVLYEQIRLKLKNKYGIKPVSFICESDDWYYSPTPQDKAEEELEMLRQRGEVETIYDVMLCENPGDPDMLVILIGEYEDFEGSYSYKDNLVNEEAGYALVTPEQAYQLYTDGFFSDYISDDIWNFLGTVIETFGDENVQADEGGFESPTLRPIIDQGKVLNYVQPKTPAGQRFLDLVFNR